MWSSNGGVMVDANDPERRPVNFLKHPARKIREIRPKKMKVRGIRSKKMKEGRKPPVAVSMRPYASRIKVRASELVESTQLTDGRALMKAILAKKKINLRDATRAIREALDAAATHQLARWCFENRRDAAMNALKDLAELIFEMEKLANIISALPPDSKGRLNRQTAQLVMQGLFDTELFFDLINLLLICLPELSPKQAAEDARRIIEPRDGESLPRILKLWESIPAVTRVRVEQRIASSTSLSGVELLRLLPNLLREYQPAVQRGAPRSLRFEYVKVIDCIWRRLNLKGRRQYAGDKGHHVKSPFQRFCDAALKSVGDPHAISVRQVVNLKRNTPKKGSCV
jgi:hypothetical protein